MARSITDRTAQPLERPVPRARDRAFVALGVSVVTALVTWRVLRTTGDPRNANDFTFYWRAARAVMSGLSPYRVINPEAGYPYNAGFLYPLPAALVALPFALFRLWPAMVAFTAALAGTLTFVMTRSGFWRLPLLMSFPMLWCAQSGQFAPLLLAAAFAPSLGGLAVAKPTIATAVFAYGLRRRFALTALLMILISLVIAPTWPNEYLAEVRARTEANYQIPLLVFPGAFLPLALLRWRRPEARLLFVMSCVPQSMLFYDQLPLATIATSFRQALIAALASYAPIIAIYFLPRPQSDSIAATVATTSVVITWMYYLPCLVVILLRPNAGSVPPLFERAASHLPRWLRGETARPSAEPGTRAGCVE